MSVAFAGHLLKAHDPGQTDEEVDQPAARGLSTGTCESLSDLQREGAVDDPNRSS
jgi:hypothetical protein